MVRTIRIGTSEERKSGRRMFLRLERPNSGCGATSAEWEIQKCAVWVITKKDFLGDDKMGVLQGGTKPA